MKRPIAIGLAPNISQKDAFAALREICKPLAYTKNNSTHLLEEWFERYFHVRHAIAFSSGRGSLFAILRGLDIGKGDEVILQAFTCAAVVQAVLTTGAKPIYGDIDDTLTFSIENVKKQISKKTKAIIVQHTFGIPANMVELQKIAKENNIFLIEDAAHTIGGKYNTKLLGTFGIASIVSFGRDKAFSCVSGGIAITNDSILGENIKVFAQKQGYPSSFWVFQQLLHTTAFYFIILPLYNIFIGKMVLVLLQKLHLLSLPVDTKRTKLSKEELKNLPPALSRVALVQLERIQPMNKRRQEIAQIYEKELSSLQKLKIDHGAILLRFPLLLGNAKGCIAYFRQRDIYLGNWYSNVIDPKGVSFAALGYTIGSCPSAEEIAKHIINLPTYATLTDKEVYTICRLLKSYAES